MFLPLLCLAIMVACSSPTDSAPPGDEPGNGSGQGGEPDGPSLALDCDALDYLACTPAQVSDAVWERSAGLMETISIQVRNGGTFEEAAAWLREQAGVRFVDLDGHLLIYVVEGGLPYSLYDAETAEGLDAPSSTSGTASTNALPSGSFPASDLGILKDVVGRGTTRDNPEGAKRALILDPFERFHTTNGAGVAEMFRELPDYSRHQGDVIHLKNTEVDLSAFANWNEFDVVLLIGHGGGRSLCEGEECVPGQPRSESVIYTGMGDNSAITGRCTAEEFEEFKNVRGLGCGVPIYRWGPLKRPHITIGADFFQDLYPGGLESTLVYLNTCFSAREDGFAEVLRGPGTLVYAWDDEVDIKHSVDLLTRFFTGLTEAGRSSGAMYDELCALDQCFDGDTARLIQRGPFEGLFVRNVVHPLHPLTVGPTDTLENGARIPVFGFPDDGLPDDLPVRLRVEGVERGALDEYFARLRIDGQDVSSVSFQDRVHETRLGEFEWEVQLRMPMQEDFTQGQQVELEFILELPGGGESRFPEMREVELVNPEMMARFRTRIDTEEMTATSLVESDWVPLALDRVEDEAIEFERRMAGLGEGDLRYLEFLTGWRSGPCIYEVVAHDDGDLVIPAARFQRASVTQNRLPPPSYLDMDMAPIAAHMGEEIRMICDYGESPFYTNYFSGALITLHQSELMLDGGMVLRVQGWLRGSGSTIATRTFARSDGLASEESEIRLRTPD